MKDLDCLKYVKDVHLFVNHLSQEIPPVQRSWSCLDSLYKDRILERYRDLIYDPVLREEAYYDLLVLLWEKLRKQTFVPLYSDAVLRYLTKAYKYMLRRHIRTRNRQRVLSFPGEDSQAHESALSSHVDFDAVFRRREIEMILAELPPRYEQFIRFFILAGKEKKEICQEMKITSRGAYQNLKARALDQFRDLYYRWWKEGRI